MSKQAKKLRQAIDVCGGVPVVVKHFGFKTQWAVYKWMDSQIPADRVLPLVELVRRHGGEIKCHDLRPDCFPSNV